MQPEAIRFFEELSGNAWPGLQTVMDDGWLIRFAAGYTRRANAVLPLYPGTRECPAKIERCERWFAGQGLPAVFKMTPAARPEELERLLAERGYAYRAPTSLQTLELGSVPGPLPPGLTVEREATEGWLDEYCRFNGVAERDRPVLRRILAAIVPEHFLVTLAVDGRAVACGMIVVERGWCGLFDVVVDPERRGRGHGHQLIRALLALGRQRGAERAYLQVMAENGPALQLYAKHGFREAYLYWYRIKENC
jgi:GNAT superfamily N-acetyltransferase